MKKVSTILLAISVLASMFYILPVYAAPNPVVYLSFEGDLKNQAGGDYNGKADGNVTFEEKGAVGKGAFINNGYIELENSKNIKFGKQMSFTMWIRIENDEIFNPGLLMKAGKEDVLNDCPFKFCTSYGNGALGSSFSLLSPDSEEGSIWESDSDEMFKAGMLKERWHHIAAVFDGKGITYYVDGKYASSEEVSSDFESFTSIFDSGKNIFLGRGDENLRGYMDEFKLFNSVLTANDVAAIALEGRKVLNNKMVLKLDKPEMIINGVEKEIDPGRGTAPRLDTDSGRTLVPIRALVEVMGGSIGFDESDQRGRVDITLGSINIKIWLYNQNAEVNGKPYELDVVPKTINGRTMLPLRFVIENLGAEVDWNQETQEITIKYAG
ncbi:MAG: stalk domain-containing protein [Bacillota bacterium]|nr:stalk domain-containing protein [Bacillota bacterium]